MREFVTTPLGHTLYAATFVGVGVIFILLGSTPFGFVVIAVVVASWLWRTARPAIVRWRRR